MPPRFHHPMLTSFIAIPLLLPLAAAANRTADDDSVAGSVRSAKAKPDQPKWDVNAPPGATGSVAIVTDEGTWMSLDVSPDGKEIAFDLLGDIYVLPIEGGDARPLREGLAWEMQPRFSPDGRFIAFTSDAAGGDNLWVMKRDGTEAKAISSEDFRLLNSPAWTPDSQFVAGRKHFNSERSLGTGEIWIYHRTGSKGVQMTKKSNDQKDLGEPAFSPDGNFLYYSEDTTPGKQFLYNKDPHGSIYAISRLDRRDGRLETFIAGQGGACRPQPSPDGRLVAFVRRVGLKTGLFVHDLDSGTDLLLSDILDRDMQETWAVHGVYPTVGWTPDSKSIVFWAGGKIHHLEVATGATREIPFRVDAKREIRASLRSPVTVQPKRFHTRMLRWVEVAPDGGSVVFQTVGKLYLRPLPSGEPRRLTADEEVVEMYPAFSPDGRQIAYATWSDARLGQIRVVAVDGGPSRTITNRPGHYVEPAWSSDGTQIVFSRIGTSETRAQAWYHDTGIYVVAATGGEARLVRRSGSNLHFANDPQRLYFNDSEPVAESDSPTTVLKSIELDGSDERTHVKSEMATEIRVSPDGQWVAFREFFNAYIVPFPATALPLDVGPKTEALPIAKVSRDSGEFLRWSADSKRLHWALGPELYARDLADAFAFLEGAPAKLPDAPEHGVDLGFDVDSDLPSGRLALVGARIITMRGDAVIESGTVVIDGNRIQAIGPAATIPVPADAYRIDLSGKTIMPGIIDVHYHGTQGSDGIIPQANWSLDAALAFGVTTAHDPSADTATIFAAAELVRAGLLTGPRLFSTGTILYGAKGSFKANIDSLDDARAHLRRMQAVGAFSVKSYNQPRREQRQQVIAAARELGMMVVPEGGSLYQHNMTMVVDGHTGIEHALPIANGYADMRQLWAGTEVGYTPTLGVGYGGIMGENYWYQESDVFANPRLRTFVPGFIVEPRARRRMMASAGDWNHVRIAKLGKQLADVGVRINVGAHGQREGLASHWEMWMLEQGGMTPHEALRAATLNGAHYLGLDGDIGSLEVGKLADLIVIDGNPLANLRVSENVDYTVLNGRIYDARTMDEVGNHPRRRRPLFWELTSPGR